MRILFFGTSQFAVPILQRLAAVAETGLPGQGGADRPEIVAVVTQPDRPRGRGLRPAPSPVKLAASRLGLPILQPVRVRHKSFLQTAQELKPDVLVLAAFGQIIPQSLLEIAPLGPINVHASLLPAYRGAAPIQRAIMNGDTVTGVTTMWMDATLDTGDILLQRSLPIAPNDTTGTLTEKLAELGADLVVETLFLLQKGACPRVPQDHSAATYAPALTPEDAVVPWNDPAPAIHNRVRALNPSPGAQTFFRGRRLKVWKTQPVDVGGQHTMPADDGGVRRDPQMAEDKGMATPGCILGVTRAGVEVATGGGRLLLLEVQPEGGRRMSASEWARGARLQVGDCFVAPAQQ